MTAHVNSCENLLSDGNIRNKKKRKRKRKLSKEKCSSDGKIKRKRNEWHTMAAKTVQSTITPIHPYNRVD